MGSSQEEKVLAGGFPNVTVLMTDRIEGFTNQYRWTNTQLCGTLKLTAQSEIEGVPLATIKVFDVDSQGTETEPIFEYELPLNFVHESELSNTLYAIKGIKGQYLGFLFENAIDKQAFSKQMRRLHNLLRKTKRQIIALKKMVQGSDITIDQFEQTDKLDELLDEADYEAKLSDIYDMLIR